MSGQSHTLRRAHQESEAAHIQAGMYQQSTIYKQEDSGTQMFTRSDGSTSGSRHQRHIDLSHVFMFPLTPVPLSLCYCDRTMVKTEKTALFRHLESKVESSFPSSASVDACVVDGSFLLRVLPPNLPTTYGKLAATILIQATALSSKHVGMESERRGTCDRNYKIIGPQQTRPADFKEALKSPSFKRELPTFLLMYPIENVPAI